MIIRPDEESPRSGGDSHPHGDNLSAYGTLCRPYHSRSSLSLARKRILPWQRSTSCRAFRLHPIQGGLIRKRHLPACKLKAGHCYLYRFPDKAPISQSRTGDVVLETNMRLHIEKWALAAIVLRGVSAGAGKRSWTKQLFFLH